jgi:hypothetical protein
MSVRLNGVCYKFIFFYWKKSNIGFAMCCAWNGDGHVQEVFIMTFQKLAPQMATITCINILSFKCLHKEKQSSYKDLSFGGIIYLAILSYIRCVNSGNFKFDIVWIYVIVRKIMKHSGKCRRIHMAKLKDAFLTRVDCVQNYTLDYAFLQVPNIWVESYNHMKIEQCVKQVENSHEGQCT